MKRGTLIMAELCCHLVPEEQDNLFTSRWHWLFLPHKDNHFTPEQGMCFWDECQSPVLLHDSTFGHKKMKMIMIMIDEHVKDQL